MLVKRNDLPEWVFIHVAETINKRREMMTDILLADLLPQLCLALLIGLYLFRAVNSGLRPLNRLAVEIGRRSPRDLSPIPETRVFTEVRALTDTINDLLARLAAAIESQRRFVANAAHQLRTPLAGLKLQAERAQREDDLAAMKPALAHIQNSADRASHLISQLLVLAKSEPSTQGHELTELDLNDLARQICMEWGSKAWQHNMDLSYEAEKGPVAVHGDRLLLQELLSNLLDNAIRYGKGGGHILVKVTALEPGFCVEDDGKGIPAAEVDKVFERFYRVPGSLGEGCGLGLAIVKEIVDLHQAKIRLSRSTLGGLAVKIVFPSTGG
jgi:two-component system sensor histidine kinase TctE